MDDSCGCFLPGLRHMYVLHSEPQQTQLIESVQTIRDYFESIISFMSDLLSFCILSIVYKSLDWFNDPLVCYHTQSDDNANEEKRCGCKRKVAWA